jgi:hypothetical protein
MLVEEQLTLQGSRAAIWKVITDIENSSKLIRGIERIEVLEKPSQGLVGLRWRETRMLFGKAATAEKWVTSAVENEYYTTRAEDGGFVFLTTFRMSDGDGGITLTSSHVSEPHGFVARLMSIPMALLFKGVLKKAILQDLHDIQAAVERS